MRFVITIPEMFLLINRKEFKMEIKGYTVPSGYMGYVIDRYMLFATENDYLEYMAETLAESR